MDLTLQLTDEYSARNQMLSHLQHQAHSWFELALGRAPVELHATLQVRRNEYRLINTLISLLKYRNI